MDASLLSSTSMRIITLVIRIVTAVTLLASLVLLLIISQPVKDLNERGEVKETWIMRFYHRVPFRYTAATIIIGAAYSIFQIVCAILRLAKRNEGNVILDFFGEEVLSKLLVSGAVAGFLGSSELVKGWEEYGANREDINSFTNKTYAANGLVLLSFFFSFVLSVLSSYALARNISFSET
ncbi:CASP-like protein 4D1 [Prunus avium]|uniref:CASP-like protein n=1 Tax=Prunus avium TaxID=42229 RepID=A0A6P5SJI4_PRUAV|nr:CASP-like protein 4D1 [Prunus avium]